jgi:mutator protein MutT
MNEPSAAATRVGLGLIRRGNQYLVRRRPEGTVYAGYWEFPGGKCEPGETPDVATARECLEETRLRVEVGALRAVRTHQYPHGLVELFFFDCTARDPAAEPPPTSGFQWVSAGSLGSLRFPEANRAVLDELAREDQRRRKDG